MIDLGLGLRMWDESIRESNDMDRIIEDRHFDMRKGQHILLCFHKITPTNLSNMRNIIQIEI
jgi:hypothetical protein